MAIINPTFTDFKEWQLRALDFKEIRSVYDVLRASSFYYRMAVKSPNLTDITEAISYGLETSAWHDDSKIYFLITRGTCIKDNQVIIFQEDFQFEYNLPQNPTTYYVYVRYKFVPERPDQVAEIVIQTLPATSQEAVEFMLIAKVDVDPNAFDSDPHSGIVLDLTPRNDILTDAHHLMATNIQGGQANALVYQVSADTTGFLTPPSFGQRLYLEWDGSAFHWVSGVTNAANVAGGDANEIVYQTAADTTGFIAAPSNPYQYLEWNGNAYVWKSSVQLSKAIEGGGSSQIVYQTAPNATDFIDAPTESNSFLRWSGSAFEWTVINRVNEANIADFAKNIQGGDANQLVFQSASNNTDFIDAPNTTDVRYLSWNGSTFEWVASIPIAQDLLGGYANQIVYQKAQNDTEFIDAPTAANTYLKWDGNAFVWDSVTYSDRAGAIAGGDANEIPYQTGTNSTSFIAAPQLNNTYLKWDGSSFVWDTAIASDLAGGVAYQIPYQANTNVTEFIAVPPSGTSAYLKWDGNSSFTWETAVGSVDVAECANNLTGGAQWKIPYQTGPNATTFAAAPTADNSFLKWDSTNGFSWSTSINLAVCSCHIKGGASNQIVYQTGPNTTSFVPAPTVNDTVLSWDSTNGFKWVTGGTGSGGTATDIAGGSANQILYQRATDDTDFITAPPSANDAYLKWDSTNGQFVWESSVGTVQVAECANNLTGGQALDIPYQSGTNATEFLNVYASTDSNVCYPIIIHDIPNGALKWVSDSLGGNPANAPYVFATCKVDTAAPGTAAYFANDNSKGNPADLGNYIAWDRTYYDKNGFLSDTNSASIAIDGKGTGGAALKVVADNQYGIAVLTDQYYAIGAHSIKCMAIYGGSIECSGIGGTTYKGRAGVIGYSYTKLSDTGYSTQFDAAVQGKYGAAKGYAEEMPGVLGCSVGYVGVFATTGSNWPAIIAYQCNGSSTTDKNTQLQRAGLSARSKYGTGLFIASESPGNTTYYGAYIQGADYPYVCSALVVCANSGYEAICIHSPSNANVMTIRQDGTASGTVQTIYANETSRALSLFDSGTNTVDSSTQQINLSTSCRKRQIYAYSSNANVSYSLNSNFGNTYYFDCGQAVFTGTTQKTVPGIIACAGNAMAAGIFTSCSTESAIYAAAYYKNAIIAYANDCSAVYGYGKNKYGIYGVSDQYAVFGYANTNYAVAGNTDYTTTSDADYKFLCEICVQECLRARPLKSYRYTWKDDNLNSFAEFIGPTVQDIEDTFDMYYEEREIDYDLKTIVQDAIANIKKPERPKDYQSDWSVNLELYKFNQIKEFEKYERELEEYHRKVREIEQQIKEEYANKPKKYIKQRYTVDGIALALANENFQCIVEFEKKFEELYEVIDSLQKKIEELEGGAQDGISEADTSE